MCVNPGFVRTEMTTGLNALREPEEAGADLVKLITLPSKAFPRGKYVNFDGTPLEW